MPALAENNIAFIETASKIRGANNKRMSSLIMKRKREAPVSSKINVSYAAQKCVWACKIIIIHKYGENDVAVEIGNHGRMPKRCRLRLPRHYTAPPSKKKPPPDICGCTRSASMNLETIKQIKQRRHGGEMGDSLQEMRHQQADVSGQSCHAL